MRNLDAFLALVELFCRIAHEYWHSGDAGHGKLASEIGTKLLKILESNPVNYFVVQPTNFLLTLAEKLDLMRPEHLSIVLQMFEFILINLNYVPFKAIACLCIHFSCELTSVYGCALTMARREEC